MPDIRSLTLADKNLVTDFLHRYPPEISEYTFTNLFIWQPSRPIWLTEIDGSLIFLVQAEVQNRPNYLLFGPPLGDISLQNIVAELGDKLAGAIRIPQNKAETVEKTGFAVF